jgi:transketolase
VEEHVGRGGLGSEMALLILDQNINVGSFRHLFARAHHYATYGSQNFLRGKSGIDPRSVMAVVSETI